MQRSRVLLPLPLGPITTSTSPASTVRSTASRTRLSPKLLRIASARTTAVPAVGSGASCADALDSSVCLAKPASLDFQHDQTKLSLGSQGGDSRVDSRAGGIPRPHPWAEPWQRCEA